VKNKGSTPTALGSAEPNDAVLKVRFKITKQKATGYDVSFGFGFSCDHDGSEPPWWDQRCLEAFADLTAADAITAMGYTMRFPREGIQ
jgi:hypothetical protein